jgi:hypothetical protein
MATVRKIPWTEEDKKKLWELYEVRQISTSEIADHYLPGRSVHAIENMLSAIRKTGGFTVAEIPRVARSIEDLLESFAQEYERKKAHSDGKRGVEIKIAALGPFALFLFGDAHLGDAGCDIHLLMSHLKLVKETPHLYGVNMGDLSNNWVGRLARLYAHQNATDDEESIAVQWLLESHVWLFVILGNHDKWSSVAQLLCRQAGVAYASHGAVLEISTPDSSRPLICDLRHTHKGNSQYNAAHAQIVQNYRGNPADIIAGAHIHTAAMCRMGNGISQKVAWCIRVGAYKKYDDYAEQLNFPEDMIGPAAVCVVQPDKAGEPGYVECFADPENGIAYLNSVRASWEASQVS